MANISTITYNGNVISEAEEAGDVAVQYEGRTLATLSAGQTKTFLCNGKVMKTNLYIGAKTLLCAMNQMIADVVVAVKSSFPAAPSYYKLISKYTSSQTFTAPESGYFQIEVFGASGKGGNGYVYTQNMGTFGTSYRPASGGGGGGGGYSCSTNIKLNKGDKVTLVCGAVGSASSATISSSLASYSKMNVTSGATGGTGTANSTTANGGTGGAGGKGSGGNKANLTGQTGTAGTGFTQGMSSSPALQTGGAGGACATNGTLGVGGNAGGKGGDAQTSASSGAAGSKGFIKIYRGNTNDINGGAISSVLDDNSWSNISKMAKEGKASQYWSVGDTKVCFINGAMYNARIIGFDHDDVADSTTYGRAKAGITFQLVEICETVKYNTTSTNSNGWAGSALRNTTTATYYNSYIETDLKSLIVPVRKPYLATYNSATISYITDSLFVLSEGETLGKVSGGKAMEGTQYSYYALGNSPIRQYNGTNTSHWTRTPRASSSSGAVGISTSGSAISTSVTNSYGFVPAFCL